MTTVAISADEQYVVSSSDDRIIHMWRMAGSAADRSLTLTKAKSMGGHTLKVRACLNRAVHTVGEIICVTMTGFGLA